MNMMHECECDICQNSADERIKTEHHQMNLLLSRLNEQQRRWYAGLEASRLGHGGIEQVAKITGMNVNTISRGQRELANNLRERPSDRIRLHGGGRKPLHTIWPAGTKRLTATAADEGAGLSTEVEKWLPKRLSQLQSAFGPQARRINPLCTLKHSSFTAPSASTR
jgi:hypothetical protein